MDHVQRTADRSVPRPARRGRSRVGRRRRLNWHPGGMAPFADRFTRVRARAADLGVDAVLLSVGPDLPYLTGYEAMPLERLTMLVVPTEGEATLVVPRLEAPRVTERPEFGLRPWTETEDPIAIVAQLLGGAGGT